MTVEVHQRAFIDHMVKNPGEYTSRLIYAEWLEEHGMLEESSKFRISYHQVEDGDVSYRLHYGLVESVLCPFRWGIENGRKLLEGNTVVEVFFKDWPEFSWLPKGWSGITFIYPSGHASRGW